MVRKFNYSIYIFIKVKVYKIITELVRRSIEINMIQSISYVPARRNPSDLSRYGKRLKEDWFIALSNIE